MDEHRKNEPDQTIAWYGVAVFWLVMAWLNAAVPIAAIVMLALAVAHLGWAIFYQLKRKRG